MTSQPVFKTYKEFANSVTPQLRGGILAHRSHHPSRFQTVDVSSTGKVDSSILELTDEETRNIEKYHARLEAERRALTALSKDVKTRLVLFEQREVESGFVHDLYGLEFQVEPSFFRACINYRSNPDYKPFVFVEGGPPAFLRLGKGWGAKFIDRGFNHALTRGGMTISTGSLHLDETSCLLDSVLISMPYTADFSKVTGNYTPATLIFVETISQWTSEELVDANEQPLKYLIPLLEWRVNHFQSSATICYEKFRADRDKQDALIFEHSWRPLRDALLDGPLPWEAFKEYDAYHFDGAVQQSSKLQQLIRQYHVVHARVLELEQHIRDELQLQVGYLSLLESKESIKQSKIALEESKRVKMLTILAFIFVPLSLATSIFGMNLQELNDEGQPTWVFLATAGAILWVAFCIWGIFYQWMKYIHAPRWGDSHWRLQETKEARDSEQEANISLFVRLRFLFWLLFHGHIIWCWRSGITFSLLTNGWLGFTPTCGSADDKYCLITETLEASSLEYLDIKAQRSLMSYSAHSPHAPCAYIYGHRAAGKSRAFSFARGV